ncbi:hypothetical protein BDDG_08925 [Blastomyces dermatitidis ATCC 18188]|uniref:GAT domain-containing protein n=1 Tax=Ajellomyces dermatitidis (strain ATCC 18188 / CBS 674.68) TaxID=653446 RepID=F2TRW7_AJEDA|nr:hypothetical protein BDDG_08925 [Blastomyces dermatitidis ATCC 18188]EQL27953.1 hypothetical protein BDFG_09242 [Blastomyces dermatitidis ATCC 26199]
MKRFVGSINKHTSQSVSRSSSYPPGSSEAVVLAELTAFCESGGPNNTGDEYLHLPAIVETAESSPSAAKAAADAIRRVLSNPDSKKGYKQYNAIMLIRILADNPGTSFTRNFDAKFVSTIKVMLRDGRDMSVQQILRETLEFLSVQKSHDPNLAPLAEMWKKEKAKFEKAMGVSAGPWAQPFNPGQRDDYFARQHRPRGLPSLEELTARIAEANTSASLLVQLVQSTPTAEFYSNDLLGEFSARCQAASRSIQGYMNATNPAPDEDTMLTLIETNDKLSDAFSKYQRAAVIARRNASRTNSQQEIPPVSQQWPYQQQLPPPPPHLHQPEQQNYEVPTGKRSVPLLSIPRKALNKFRSDKQEQPIDAQLHQYQHPASFPQTLPEQTTTTTGARWTTQTPRPRSAVSPLATTPPQLPSTNNQHTTTVPSRTAALTSHATHTSSNNATSSPYHYNSSEFQVENPFADTYSTSTSLPDNNLNSNHTTTTTRGGVRGIGVIRTDRDTDTEPLTSSTYYPDARNVMVDGNMPGAGGAVGSTAGGLRGR